METDGSCAAQLSVEIEASALLRLVTAGAAVPGAGGSGGCRPRPRGQPQAPPRPPRQGRRSLPPRQLRARPSVLPAGTQVNTWAYWSTTNNCLHLTF